MTKNTHNNKQQVPGCGCPVKISKG